MLLRKKKKKITEKSPKTNILTLGPKTHTNIVRHKPTSYSKIKNHKQANKQAKL